MRRTARIAMAMLGLCAAAALVTSAATAAAGKHPATAHRATHIVAGKHLGPAAPLPNAVPPKYTVVTSALLTANPGTQTTGTATCPAKTVPYGGGAVISSISLTTNMNSSVPLTTGWRADINNAGGTADTFRVYAVCAKKNASYSVVTSSAVTNPAASQNSAIAQCPAGTKVTGGGSFSSSGSTLVNMNTTIPIKSGNGASAVYSWRTDENNGSTGSATVTAYAVCGHAAGYKMVVGTATPNPASSQTAADVSCPSSKVPLGGGGFSSSGSTSVSLNSSVPLSNSWRVYENNNTTSAPTITAYVICAGT